MGLYILNAAPQVYDLGINDLSTRRLPREPEAIPQHCPKFYILAQKGPITPQLVGGVEMTNMYGIDSFDPRKEYYNYSTAFVTAVNAKANLMMLERVIPEDAGPESNMVIYLDVLETTVDDYERNVDGSVKLDSLGNPIVAGTVIGHKVKWVKQFYNTVDDLQNKFQQAKIIPGNQTDASGNQSQRYPIFELKVGSRGGYGNNVGIRMWAPNKEISPGFPTSLLEKKKTFPYFISVINRDNPDTSPKVKDTLYAEKYVSFVLKKDTIDPLTDARMYIGDKFINAYQNLTDMRYPAQYGDFSTMAIYQNNIDYLLAKFHNAEKPYVTADYDFTTSDEDLYAFNLLSGCTSTGYLYHSYQLVDATDAIRLSEYSNVFADGGSDGTLDNAHYCAQVKDRVTRYSDPMDELMDLPVHVESIMYDTGFPLEIKKLLPYFISQRKDTFVVLGTHDAADRTLLASEEAALAVALRSRLQLFPESDFWGTPVTRGMIMGRSGLIRNNQYIKRLPLTYEVAIKAARYMGASNGRWKNGAHFDGAPGSIVEAMNDINIKWVPTSVRNRNWDIGLNWVQAYDRRSFFFPAFKTVYEDDTSVLNSFITAMACCYLNKVAHATWREFSGVSYLTNVQFLERINSHVTKLVEGRFDGRFVIQPAAYIDEYDALRGYSWHLPIKIYSPSLKSAMVASTYAYRIDPDTPVYTAALDS